MYPLLLKPPVKDYLWGGTKLKTDFCFETEKEIAAEAWVLSCHKDGANTVINGEHKGKTITEVLDIWGKSALGKNAEKFSYFPILIKLIDAENKLSIQVHPDDDYAMSVEGEFGKTEMWYVVDCKKGAELIYGFKDDISKKEFERRIKDNTLTDVCNSVPVNKGDVFFITAGTLHAIGEGILIAEVQQNSNTTYRVSDYGRLGADGKPRELHIEKALDVTKCIKPELPYGPIGEITTEGKNTIRDLASCDKFTAKLINLKDTMLIGDKNTFVSLLLLEGDITLECDGAQFSAKKGDSIFVPAGLEVEIKGNAQVLYSCI
ncbi:MAG: class I mannose-6-phosphate isomerase [Oscillospiraceae bacterium]|nr:class I mannose-6-phosphate isomerase [Oscillospiraceae bacterium]